MIFRIPGKDHADRPSIASEEPTFTANTGFNDALRLQVRKRSLVCNDVIDDKSVLLDLAVEGDGRAVGLMLSLLPGLPVRLIERKIKSPFPATVPASKLAVMVELPM